MNALIALFHSLGLTHHSASIDTQLSASLLHNPESKITTALLTIYSLETFLPSALNRAIRERDQRCVATLGAFAVALREVVLGAEMGKPGAGLDHCESTFYRPALMYGRDL